MDRKGLHYRQFFELILDLSLSPSPEPSLLGEIDNVSLALLDDVDSDCGEGFLCDFLWFIEQCCRRPSFASILIDRGMVRRLYEEYLMAVPASNGLSLDPLCQDPSSRGAAWSLLLALTRHSPKHSSALVDLILTFLRNTRVPTGPDGAEDWRMAPAVARRKGMPYIGMRNPG
eukprot:CAMPEP_0114122246 /NCGR_PEP_ID=MMETSP0043_2-20121206/7595_1 /TAXON_ID=464988 /ORGANISM="Hemiselmis andersenii, Strain CCMP644" /LENGTH=172 /DNA_ID=CAMNT_0001214953 /DNA_START=145 /DNA_END=660 /DNA_ORIENTATION=-